MKKRLLLLATLGCSISWIPAHATTITIDLGPPGRVTGEKIVSFSELNDLPLSGQTLSLDLVFSDNGFVRLRSEEHTSELQSRFDLVCRLLLEKKKKNIIVCKFLLTWY